MEKIKVVGNLIELSGDDQLVTVNMEAIVRVKRNVIGTEVSLLGGDVIDVDQDYEDIVKAWEDYYAGPAAGGAAPVAEEKTEFDVELTEIGAAKLKVVKAVEEACGLDLKEAKDLVDNAPSIIKKGMAKKEAENLKKTIEAEGAKVTLK